MLQKVSLTPTFNPLKAYQVYLTKEHLIIHRVAIMTFISFCHWNIYLFYLFFNFIFTLFYFTILYGFCHTLAWIRHECTWVPNPESPFHLPPRIISLDHPCAPAPSILYPASDIDWRFISYMIVYMFHNPELNSFLSHIRSKLLTNIYKVQYD